MRHTLIFAVMIILLFNIVPSQSQITADIGTCVDVGCTSGNGHGIMKWSDGSKYEGDFKDGKISGQGTLYDANGNIVHQGRFENGKFVPTNKEEASSENENLKNNSSQGVTGIVRGKKIEFSFPVYKVQNNSKIGKVGMLSITCKPTISIDVVIPTVLIGADLIIKNMEGIKGLDNNTPSTTPIKTLSVCVQYYTQDGKKYLDEWWLPIVSYMQWYSGVVDSDYFLKECQTCMVRRNNKRIK